MIRPITYNLQKIQATDHALIVHQFYGERMGILMDCPVTHDGQNIYIGTGYFITMGRLTCIPSVETIPVTLPTSGLLYCVLIWDIDLSKTNTTTDPAQSVWRVLTSPAGYPDVIQDDLFHNTDGGRYQQIWTRFMTDINGISEATFEVIISSVGTPESLLSGAQLTIQLAPSGWVDVDAAHYPDHTGEWMYYWPVSADPPNPWITPQTGGDFDLTYADKLAARVAPNDCRSSDGRIVFFAAELPDNPLDIDLRLINGLVQWGGV